MINKLYVKGRKILKENIALVCMIGVFILLTMPLPYYIDTPGGAIQVNDKFTIKEAYKSKGAFHLAYVAERKATPLTLLYAQVKKDWEVKKKNEIKYESETIKEMNFREKMLMEESFDNAVWVAYLKAGKEIEITKEHLYVTYIDKKAQTTLQVGDEILTVDGQKIATKKELLTYIKNKKAKESITIEVKNGKKEYQRKAVIIEENQMPKIGIMLSVDKIFKTDPEIQIHSKKRESGPSGGLMLSLSIYDALTKEDITKGRKIVGTGTIDEEGNIGGIGGVPFKLKGAVKEKADLFMIPKGENYKEAMKIKKEKNYNIEIIGVSTVDEALTYLRKKA